MADQNAQNTSFEPVQKNAASESEFENLTIAEMVSRLTRAPFRTARAMSAVARTSPNQPSRFSPEAAPELAPGEAISSGSVPAEIARGFIPAETVHVSSRRAQREAFKLGVRVTAFLVALWGSGILVNTPERTAETALVTGAPFLITGFLLWLLSESADLWWRVPGEVAAPPVSAGDTHPHPAVNVARARAWQRGVWLGVGLAATTAAWELNVNNQFTLPGVVAWLVSIVAWATALAPAEWSYREAARGAIARARSFRAADNWTFITLALIVVLAAFFRLSNLSSTPPEMTSDHVEKILDSARVARGETDIFFANNGGREPAQMYLMAVLASVPGFGMNFTTLKLLSALEGIITIPALWWMGRELIGEEDRRLGNLVGLALAALVAASYWHTALSRLGLRIVLTPLVTALLLIFLARAMRHNRRADFVLAGLTLGFGLYCYQAVRMLPVVVVVGIGLAFAFHAKGLRARRDYLLHLAALVLMAFVVFVPLFHYSVQYPENFWRRTSGRLLGDDVIQTTDEQGNVVQRDPTMQERFAAFNRNLPVLLDNIRNALLMYNWKGDVAWINGAPNYPAMDTIAGTLLALGLAAWLARMVRRRDVVDWLIPLAIFIMLLPSALSIAYPIENPSATRTSGSLPGAYLIAALPLALMVGALPVVMQRRGMVVGALAALALVGASYFNNALVYFDEYRDSYLISSLPYSEAGRRLRGFADSDGSFGNAFMIAYPYWWDHRAIGIEAGVTDWPNGVVELADLPEDMFVASQRTGMYRLDPNKDLLFFYAPGDDAAQRQLEQWFPSGYWQEVTSYQPENAYRMFRVPRLGEEGFSAFIMAHYSNEG